MKMVVDRFESDIAVCENMETRDLVEYSIESLPKGVSPGDVLVCEDSVIVIDHAETKERKTRIKKMFDSLWG